MYSHQNPVGNHEIRDRVGKLIATALSIKGTKPAAALECLIQGISLYLIYPFRLIPQDIANFQESQKQLVGLINPLNLSQLQERSYQYFDSLIPPAATQADAHDEATKFLLANINSDMLLEMINVWNIAGSRSVSQTHHGNALKYFKLGYRLLRDLVPEKNDHCHFVQITRSYASTLYQLSLQITDHSRKTELQTQISHLYRVIPAIYHTEGDIAISISTNTELAIHHLKKANKEVFINYSSSKEMWDTGVFYLAHNNQRLQDSQQQICELLRSYAVQLKFFVDYNVGVQLFATLLDEYKKIDIAKVKPLLPHIVAAQRHLIKIHLDAGKLFLTQNEKYHLEAAANAFEATRQLCDQIMYPHKNLDDHHAHFIATQQYVMAVFARINLSSQPFNEANIDNISHAIYINDTINKMLGSKEQEKEYYKHQYRYAEFLSSYSGGLYSHQKFDLARDLMQACVNAIDTIPHHQLNQLETNCIVLYRDKLEMYKEAAKNHPREPQPRHPRPHSQKLFSPAPSPELKPDNRTLHSMVEEVSPDHFSVTTAFERMSM